MSRTLSSAGGAEQAIITEETEKLRYHLGLGESPSSPGQPAPSNAQGCIPLFVIELAPYSARGAKCKFPSCGEQIMRGEYRVALVPGMSGPEWLRASRKTVDFYHIACFEKIADLSQADYLDRIQPLTSQTAPLRNLSIASIMDGNNLLDGGAEQLIYEWKWRRGKWIDDRAGVEEGPSGPASENSSHDVVSSTLTAQPVPNISSHEQDPLQHSLAPSESDDSGDTDEWNLFDAYLNARDDEESLHERHNLSRILQRWKHDRNLASSPDHFLSDDERQAKGQLDEKAVRAITRLCSVQMPDIQSMRFAGRF